ncbi:hypothetical protein [Kalamiella sp. sgz302252]|uniref:hypothetical protein n=1 Tax=Pantoea sp. sgz302252 TaxID=3341827 RepID=UPI0036D3064B
MTVINSLSQMQSDTLNNEDQTVVSLDDKANSVADSNGKLAYMMMYEQWKTDILLSDGLNEDENAEW